MNRASRLLAPAGRYSEATESTVLDMGLLFLRLILFDQYVIMSRSLTEIPALVRELGYGKTMALLKSGLIRILLDTTSIGQIGQSDLLLPKRPMGILPPGCFAFAWLRQDPDWTLDHSLRNVEKIDTVGSRKLGKLKNKACELLIDVPEDHGNAALGQFKEDLWRNDPAIRSAVLAELQREGVPFADPSRFELKLEKLSDFGDVRAEIGVGEDLHLDEQSRHRAIERGLMAVAGLDMRLQQMRDFELVTGFESRDVPVLDGRVSFFTQDLAPERQQALWRRVIEITGLPDIGRDPGIRRIDVEKVIDLAKSKECQDFRRWLRSSDSLSAEEIRDYFYGVIARASLVPHGIGGRTVRFVVSTLADLPAPLSIVVGGLDTFVVDKLLPEPGPVAFIDRIYPSLFRTWLPPQNGPPLLYRLPLL